MEVKVGGLIPNLIRALKEKRKKKNAPIFPIAYVGSYTLQIIAKQPLNLSFIFCHYSVLTVQDSLVALNILGLARLSATARTSYLLLSLITSKSTRSTNRIDCARLPCRFCGELALRQYIRRLRPKQIE